MPREARKRSRTGIYHIIMRGINKQTIFEENEDKERFLDILKKYKQISNYSIYSFCLMENQLLWKFVKIVGYMVEYNIWTILLYLKCFVIYI